MPIYDSDPDRTVRFICTDRGAHPSREILIIHRDRATGEYSQGGTGATTSGRTVHRRDALVRTDSGRSTWDLPQCPTCPRAPDLSSDRMHALVDGILASDPEAASITWDVSYLD